MSFFKRNDTYIKDQKENYTYMVNDLSEFLRHKYELAGQMEVNNIWIKHFGT